jgi:hypothetical protein
MRNLYATVSLASLLLASFLGVAPASAAIVHGTGGNNGSQPSSASSVTATLPAVASGSLVTGVVQWTPPQTLTSVKSGTGSDVCTIIGSPTAVLSGTYEEQFFACPNVTDSPTSFVATFSAATAWPTLMVDPFTGVTGTVDAGAVGATGSSTALSSGSMTTATAGDLVYAAGYSYGGSPTLSAGSGFTLAQGPAGLNEGSEYLVQAAAGAVTATMTSSASQAWGLSEIAFKASSSGGGGNFNVTCTVPETVNPSAQTVTVGSVSCQ